MTQSDEELVAAFQGGDASAFDTLMSRWERKIQGAIVRIMGPGEESRDLAQETFFKAYRALGGFKGQARFSSWLYQIAVNLCRDRMRRKKGRHLVSLDDLEEAGQERAEPGPSVHEIVESAVLARAVAGAVATLPAEQREVIVLKEYEGMTFAEISEVTGLPVSTVKTRLYRGLGLLRGELERAGVGHSGAPL